MRKVYVLITMVGALAFLLPLGPISMNSGQEKARGEQAASIETPDQLPLVEATATVPGSAPTGWRVRLAQSANIRYRDAYPGVDLAYAGTPEELDAVLIVNPGADPAAIHLDFLQAEAIIPDGQGHIWILTNDSTIGLLRPQFMHTAPSGKPKAKSQKPKSELSFLRLDAHHVGVRVGDYDSAQPLLIRFEVVFIPAETDNLVGESVLFRRAKLENWPTDPPAIPAQAPIISVTKTVDMATADPGDTLMYTVTITNTGGVTATGVTFTDTIDANTTLVMGSVNSQPIANPDAYTGSGNIPISLNAMNGVLANDVDPDTGNNTGLTVTQVQGIAGNVGMITATTATGIGGVTGFVTLNADGSFDYEPPPGFTGMDTFTYQVSDAGGKTDTATVTITISQMVWFINNSAGGLNRGTFSNPFTSLASFNAVNMGAAPNPQPGHFIALRTGTYSEADGINLRDTQVLIGEAVQFNTVFMAAANSSAAYQTFASGTMVAPAITTSAGHGVDLASGNTVRGLNVGNTPGFFGFNGGAVGSPTINSVNVTGTGGAINIATSGAFGMNVTFATLESTSSSGSGINLQSVTGTLGVASGGMGLSGSAASSAAISINGGSVSMTYPGNVTKSNAGSLLGVSNGHTGTLTFNTGTISATAGDGLQFNNADGTYNFNGTTTLNGGDAGIDIIGGSSGTFTFSSLTTITSPSGTAFNINASNANGTYSGSITQNTAGQRVINIDGTTGGTVTFNTGTITGGQNSTGININNANGNVSFANLNLGTSGSRMTNQAVTITNGTGTYSLGAVSIFTSNVQGIVATNADGTLNSTSGTVDAIGHRAINIDGPAGLTTLGMTLTKVAATNNGGTLPANGIFIQDTNGSFTVTGDGVDTTLGGNQTGGVISNTTGADGTTNGIGVYLSNVQNVTLRRMRINDHPNFAIRGLSVNGFTLDYSTVDGTNGTNGITPFQEASLFFTELTGSGGMTGVIVSGGRQDNVHIENTGGTLSSFTVSNSTIQNNSTSTDGNVGFHVMARTTANMTVTIQNCMFQGNRTDTINTDAADSSTLNITISGNTIVAGTGGNNQGNLGIDVTSSASSQVTFAVTNNKVGTPDGATFQPLINHGINVFRGANSGTMSGTVTGNTVLQDLASTNSGSGIIVNHSPTSTTSTSALYAKVDGNVVSGSQLNYGILIDSGGIPNATGTTQVQLTNNTVQANMGSGALDSIRVTARRSTTACYEISGNVASTAGMGFFAFYLRKDAAGVPPATMSIEGLAAGTQTDTTTKAYIASTNSISGPGVGADVGSTYTGVAADFCSSIPPAPPPPVFASKGQLEVELAETQDQGQTAVSRQPSAVSHQQFLDSAALISSVEALRDETTPVSMTLISSEANAGVQGRTPLQAAGAIPTSVGEPLRGLPPPVHTTPAVAIQRRTPPQNTDTNLMNVELRHSSLATGLSPTAPGARNKRQETRSTTTDTGHRMTDKSPKVLVGSTPDGTPIRLLARPESGETISIGPFNLPAGESVQIMFSVTIDNPLNAPASQVCNQGSVSGSNFSMVLTDDPNVGGAADPTCTTLNLPDLVVTKTDSPDPVIAGNTITYTINLANIGPAAASTVTLTDAVPANTTFVSAMVTNGSGWSTSAPAVGGTGNVVFSKATVAASETATFQIVVQVNTSTANGAIITNTATAATTTSEGNTANNTGTATTTVQTQADLSVTKSDSPDPVTVGSNLTYTINFTNNGPSDAQTVTVTDAVPGNTTFVSAMVTTGSGWSTTAPAVGGTGNVIFSKATVAASESASFTIVVKVNGSAPGGTIISNTATAASATTDPTPGNNSATATTTAQASADLALTKTDSPDPVTAGSNLTYTINFTNNGPGDAQAVTVTDAVPGNTTFVSAMISSGSGWSTSAPAVGSTGNVVFSKATVAAGESAVFTIVVKVNATAASGSTITNTATADSTPGNNSATATTTVQTSADLALTKTDSPDPVTAGQNITYTINFTNNGPSDAQSVTVTDAVPANTTFVSAMVTTGLGWSTSAPALGSTGNVIFSKATVAAGESAVLTIVVEVNASAASGSTITNTATAASSTADSTPGNNSATATTTIQTSADLALTKTDSPDPVTAGQNITYTINFTNNGPSDAQTVTVTDAVPANTTFVSTMVTSGSGWGTTAPAVGGTGNVVFSKATVAAGESAVFTIVVKVNASAASGSTITNMAAAASATTDPTPGNNSGTATTTVQTQADLAVTKGDSPDPVVVGNDITYTINFTNNGPSDAQTVTVTDTVPTNTTFVSAIVTSGSGWSTSAPALGSAGTVIFSKATVAASESAVFTIVVKVDLSAADGSTITNTANAASLTTDPTPGNNSGMAMTTVLAQADLELTKSDSPDPVMLGGNLTYTVTVTNHGPVDAQSVSLMDTVPANTTFVSNSGAAGWSCMNPMVGGTGMIVCTTPTLNNGASATFTIVVKVAPAACGATITNTATVSSATPDSTTGNNTAMTMTATMNNPPMADAGLDQQADEGQIVTLSGMAMDADLGQTLSVMWTQVSGPVVMLMNADSLMPTFTAPQVGVGMFQTLTFQLKVTDACGAMATDTITVNVDDVLVVQADGGGNCLRLFPSSGTFTWRLPDGTLIRGTLMMTIQYNGLGQPVAITLQGMGEDGEILQGGISLLRNTASVRLTTADGIILLGSIVDTNTGNNSSCP